MEGYRFSMPWRVRSAEINYGGHVSNAAFLNYFQDGRIAYLAQLGPYSEKDIGGGFGLIVAEARVRYLAELFLGDELEMGVRVAALRSRSFVMDYRIERAGAPCAEGSTGLVCFDYGHRRARTLWPAFREAVARYEGLPGATTSGGATGA